jgi:cGMP-dependent protein kinase
VGEEKVAHNEIDAKDVQFLSEVEKGNESRLMLLKWQDRLLMGKLYVKRELEKSNTGQIVAQEMQVSRMAEHPFLPRCFSVITTEKHMLKLSEFVQGESLYDSIREMGLLSSLDTQFYAASLILLLEYFMTK